MQKIPSLFAAVVVGAGLLAMPNFAAQPDNEAANRRVTAKLEAVLRERVSGPAGNLKLLIKPTSRAAEGYFDEIRIESSPIKLKKMRMSTFFLDARHVQIDVKRLFENHKVDTLAAQTVVKAGISEDDLTDLLAQGKSTKDMGLKVKYQGDKMSVSGTLNFPLLNGPIDGIGKLRLAPGHKVYLDILSLKLRGVETPQFVKSQLENRLNPVIDYKDVPFSPPLKGVVVNGTMATIHT